MIRGGQVGSLRKVHGQETGIKGGREGRLKDSYVGSGKSQALGAKK